MIGSLAEGRYNVLKKLDPGPQPATLLYLVEDLSERRARRTLRLLELGRDRDRRIAHFERELEALAKLQHPNLQKFVDFGVTPVALPGVEGTYLFIASEHVDGPDIFRFAARASWALFLEITVQALRGLEFLHGQGLVHGALAPESVLVAGRGPRKTAKLCHFALASKGLVDPLPSTRFLAPEVLGGDPADRRADLYSLGAVLYEAATRQPIAAGKTKEAILAAAPPAAPREVRRQVPKPVEELIFALTARDPAERPSSANAVIRELNKTAHKRFSVETKEAKVAAVLTPRFLGRDDELADLEGIAARALAEGPAEADADDPIVVAISGEAGVGKSRLLRELKGRLHGKSHSFVEARATEAGPSPVLELVRRAIAALPDDRSDELSRIAAPLARLRPDLGVEPPAPLAPEDERLRLADAAVRTLLAAARIRPLVLAVEDLHDADPLSLETLRLLVHDVRGARARRGAEALEETPPPPDDAPLLVLVSLSHEELPGKPVERGVRDLLQQDGVREVALERLPKDVLESVCASALGRELGQVRPLAARIAAEADGSPLVAEEMLAALADEGRLPPPDGAFKLDPASVAALEVPSDLGELARARLARLPDDARALVHALALSPAPRDSRALAAALELDDAEVLALGRELERRRLTGAPVRDAVGADGDDSDPWLLSLENAALRDAALADLAPEEVEAIDDGIGRALAERAVQLEGEGALGLAHLVAEDAARHLLKGSRRLTGAPFVLPVAGWLARAGVPERAEELLSRALAALDEAARRGERRAEEGVDATRALEDVAAPTFVQSLAASDLELAILLERGQILLRASRPQDARAELERALVLARGRRRPREAVTALVGTARAAAAVGDRVKARARSEEALALAREVDWPRGVALAQRELGLAQLELGDLDDGVVALEAALKLEDELKDKAELAQTLRDLARALEEKGELETAIDRAARARDLDEESERPSGVSAAYLRLASVHLQKGDHARALELARRAIALAREAGDTRGSRVALSQVALVLATRGENDDAIARFESALRLALRSADAEGTATTRAELARVLEARGRFEEAQVHLEAAIKLFSQLKRRTAAGRATVQLAQNHLMRGDVTRARDAIDRAAQELDAGTSTQAPAREADGAWEGAPITPVALEALHLRAEIAFRQGDLGRAEELAKQCAEDAARTAQKRTEGRARITLGAVRLRRGRLADAEKEHKEARVLAQSLADRSLEARARLALARVHLVRPEPVGALGEFEGARDAAQTLGEVELEVRSLLGLGRLYIFLGQPRRAEQILEPARRTSHEIGLGLVRPEVTLAKVEASQAARKLEGEKPSAARSAELAAVDALLEEADRDARATSRRGLRAEIDLVRGQEELLRGNPTGARERAEAGLEAAKISGDVLLAARSELIAAEARLASNRVDEARAAAERALALAEQADLVEAKAHALLIRARALAAQEAPRAAARDLREAAALVRATWAALPENLREAYGKKPLAHAIRKMADEVVARSQPAAHAAAEGPAPAAAEGPAHAHPPAEAPGPSPSRAQPRAPSESLAPASRAAPAATVVRDEPGGEGALGASTPAQVSLETLKDPLTALYNHTYFTAQLEVEIKRSQRHSRPLSLLKINIDRFKLVRELYGPRTGKRIIREVAAVLVRNLRDVDVIARYFGDEFEALLPDTPAAGAVLTADRLRAAVESTAFHHEGEKIDLTVSVGVATFPSDAKDRDALTCRVDEALYNARSRGPNKTFAFSTKDDREGGATEPDQDLREIDSLLLSREGRLILSMVNRVVNSELDLDRLIALTTGMVVEATRGERGFFLLRGRDGELHYKHGRNIEDRELQSPEFKISSGIAREVARTGEPVLVEEALDDARFREFKSVMDLRLRSILCAPIKTQGNGKPGEVLGVIYIDHNSIARHFSKEDLNFLTAIAQKISIPLKNSKVLREAEEQLEEVRAKLKTSQDQLETKYRYDKIIGATEPMQRIFKLLDRIVETHHSVVIHGESGTGKELIARAIHYNGPRKNKPFVAENCAALTDTLLEAELFGHVKGAFTGADKDAKGLFELANGGTLFLDEIGDMSERMQKKLLRVLQEGEVRPVGGKKIIKVDVRIISASNKDLKKLVQERKFREDLYYRLNVITVNLPPLRERREDIPLLVDHFLRKVSGDPPKPMERDVLKLLCAYDWPGNVRELENEMNRMVAMSDTTIDVNALSPKIREGAVRADPKQEDGLSKYYDRPLKEVEFEVMKDIILRTLERTNWHRTKAAKILRVPTSTLFNKMKKYGIG
jgi:Nif-specific regulatory protein